MLTTQYFSIMKKTVCELEIICIAVFDCYIEKRFEVPFENSCCLFFIISQINAIITVELLLLNIQKLINVKHPQFITISVCHFLVKYFGFNRLKNRKISSRDVRHKNPV